MSSVQCLMCSLAALTGNALAQAHWTGYTAQPRPASLRSNHGNSLHASYAVSIIPASAKKSHIEAAPIISSGSGCSTCDAGGYAGCDSGYCGANEGSHGLGHFSRLRDGGCGCGSGWYVGGAAVVINRDNENFKNLNFAAAALLTLVLNNRSADKDYSGSVEVSIGKCLGSTQWSARRIVLEHRRRQRPVRFPIEL